MKYRQGNAIHRGGKQRRRINRSLDWETTKERRGFRSGGSVGAKEMDVCSRLCQPGLLEDVGKPNAGPLGVSHSAFFPVEAGYDRLEIRPAVPRALEHGGDRHLLERFQVVEPEFKFRVDESADLKRPRSQPNRRFSEMASDKKIFIASDPAVERGHRGFEVDRAAVSDDQFCLRVVFAREGDSRARETERGDACRCEIQPGAS